MSYQFEDDSALEELLNQQLDSRRRQQGPQASSAGAGNRPLGRPTTTTTRPASSSLTMNRGEPDVDQPPAVEQPKGKLASWLDGKKPNESKASVISVQEKLPFDEPSNKLKMTSEFDIPKDSLVESLKEPQLREMSKQSLVRLLVSQVEPELRSLNRKLVEHSKLGEENESLQRQLAMEASKFETLEERNTERLRLNELTYEKLIKQLETRLEARELELKELSERQSSLMSELEEKHLNECSKLAESYRKRLDEEKGQFEESMRRREEFHKLELESKLKVNCDLKQLEIIFAEWNQMVQSTLSEFNGQHKQFEAFLNKQTVQINSSNLELARQSKSLSDQYGTFVEQTGRLSKLADQVESNLPRLLSVNDSNEELARKISDKLAEFVPLNEELRAQERQIERLKDELRTEKERVAQERFQLGLDSNRLIYREERLNELELLNEQTSQRLADQLRASEERENQLRLARSQSEARSEELREQNYELHQNRKRLMEREEKLGEVEARLRDERGAFEADRTRAAEEARKLETLRDKARKELQQLKRLQKALVCSICLERLFKSAPGKGELDGFGESEFLKQKVDSNLELANFNRYVEAEGRQLEEESHYVQLISLGAVGGRPPAVPKQTRQFYEFVGQTNTRLLNK